MNPSASSASLTTPMTIVSWVARIVAAIVLVQTLYFKFTGAPESVYIFTTVGLEPWGRYGSGVVELIASVLLFVPGMTAIGAALAFGAMAGAIFFHLTKLGIAVQGDDGLLSGLAVTVLICSAVLLIHRRQLPIIGSRL